MGGRIRGRTGVDVFEVEGNKVGCFAEGVELVRRAAEAQPGTVIVDGARMIPHLPDVCSDKYLHPNDYGFKFYANALFDAMLPHLGKE